MMKPVIYTIGYTSFPLGGFLRVLKEYGIECVIDVRSAPHSAFYPDYNADKLKGVLRENGILYRNYAMEFGARQGELFLYPNGYLDFEKFAQTQPFLLGIEKIDAAIEKGYTITLMCAEMDPFNCHRSILVGRRLKEHGYTVLHIGREGTQTQEDIERRLLDFYFPTRNQLSLFDTRTDEELLAEAYRKRNVEIGYHMEET